MDYVWKAGILCTLAGYLLGSILFAPFFVRLFRNIDLEAVSKDGNPGTANAFIKGGFWCGSLALLGDLGKGILPVALFLRAVPQPGIWLLPVMLAPVAGHAYPLYSHFQGGKCIAVSFGVLLGLFPEFRPAVSLAIFYILFSAMRIQPHSRRTLAAFLAASAGVFVWVKKWEITASVWLISALVIHKHAVSERKIRQKEEPEEAVLEKERNGM